MGTRFGTAEGKPAMKSAVALIMALQAGFCAYAAFRFFDESALDDPIMGISLALLALLFVGGAMLMTGQVMDTLRQIRAAKKPAILDVSENKPPV